MIRLNGQGSRSETINTNTVYSLFYYNEDHFPVWELPIKVYLLDTIRISQQLLLMVPGRTYCM